MNAAALSDEELREWLRRRVNPNFRRQLEIEFARRQLEIEFAHREYRRQAANPTPRENVPARQPKGELG